MNYPWMKLHTRDWLDNKELRRCSPLSRSVLADLMCLAHEGVPYGYLTDKVGALTEKYMASRCVVPLGKFRAAVKELQDHGRLSESETKTFFIQRMVDDEDLRKRRASGGSASVGHPNTPPKKQKEGYPPVEIDSCERAGAGSGSESGFGFVSKKTSLLDDFENFQVAAISVGLPFSEIDIADAKIEWKKLDFTQKLDAVNGLVERKQKGEYDDQQYRPLPQNYIRKRLWQRPIRADPDKKTGTVMDQAEEILLRNLADKQRRLER